MFHWLLSSRREKTVPDSKPEKAMHVVPWVPYIAAAMCVVFLAVQTYQVAMGAALVGH